MEKRTAVEAHLDGHSSDRPCAHVLLVDDDEDFAESLALVLQLEGHRVTVQHRGAEALSAFAAESFDLVILDVRMPDVDGVECFARLRAIDPGARVVFVTGMRDEAMSREATDSGALAVLDKPVELERLFTLLRGGARGGRE